jgi:hypothetical protein
MFCLAPLKSFAGHFVWIACGVALLLLVVLLNHLETPSADTSAGVDSGKSRPTIFVAIASYRTKELHAVIDRMFQSACYSKRISCGVLEYTDSEEGVRDRIDRLHLISPEYMPRMRYKKNREEHIYGASVARQQIMDELYSGQDLVLFVHSNSWFLDNWDVWLELSLEKAHNKGGRMISMIPSVVSNPRIWVESLSSPEPPNYPFLERFCANGTPVFNGRPTFQKNPGDVLPSFVATYQCLFGSAEAVFHSGFYDPGVPHLRPAESDWILSSTLWCAAMQTYTPLRAPIVRFPSIYHSHSNVDKTSITAKVRWNVLSFFIRPPTRDIEKDIQKYAFLQRFRSLASVHPVEYQKWLQVDPWKKEVGSKRAIIGLYPDHPEQSEEMEKEIVVKFGSKEAFKVVLRKFTK